MAQDRWSLIRSSLCRCNLVSSGKIGETWLKVACLENVKKNRGICMVQSRCETSWKRRRLFFFFFFPRALRFNSFYATVRTQQSVSDFEVRCCSSLSAQSVLESPAGETHRAARQPGTVGRRKEEGEKPFASPPPLSRVHFSPHNRLKPERTVCGRVAQRARWIIRVFFPSFLDKKAKQTLQQEFNLSGELLDRW